MPQLRRVYPRQIMPLPLQPTFGAESGVFVLNHFTFTISQYDHTHYQA